MPYRLLGSRQVYTARCREGLVSFTRRRDSRALRALSQPAWGQQPQSPDRYLLQRYLLLGDLHLGDNLRVFAELMSDWENYRVGGPRPQIDEDQLDFSQFFVDATLHPFSPDNSLTFRMGRQWLIYGSQRLISDRYGPNVPLPFDGFRAILAPDEKK